MDSLWDLGLYLLIYSFFGWLLEAGYYAAAKRRFCNRGVLSLPLVLSYGVTFVLLIVVLPTLAGRPVISFLAILIASSVIESLSNDFLRRVGPKLQWEPERSRLLSGTGKGILASLAVAAVYDGVYLIVHPLILALALLLPEVVKQILVTAGLVLVAADFITVFYAVRTGDAAGYERRQENSGQRILAGRLSGLIWRRLHNAYPDIQAREDLDQGAYTFAKGLCLDKLIWVFLCSALLGDIIETFWCGLVNGQWMSRSSVLYGPFSFVWGLGAVVLTITLQRLAHRDSFFVFAAGFVIGGTYEYMCSVFTELVFGTVFWDYSHMPLNIGGRTNVLFCFFWGLLAVVWIKGIYPYMSRAIELIPALAGKAATWAVVLVMVCNGLLTCAAMLRYSARPLQAQPANSFEAFLDRQYSDSFMERRWPNMVVTGG